MGRDLNHESTAKHTGKSNGRYECEFCMERLDAHDTVVVESLFNDALGCENCVSWERHYSQKKSEFCPNCGGAIDDTMVVKDADGMIWGCENCAGDQKAYEALEDIKGEEQG